MHTFDLFTEYLAPGTPEISKLYISVPGALQPEISILASLIN